MRSSFGSRSAIFMQTEFITILRWDFISIARKKKWSYANDLHGFEATKHRESKKEMREAPNISGSFAFIVCMPVEARNQSEFDWPIYDATQ